MCSGLITVTIGQVACETISDDHSYRVVEEIHNIHTIEPNKLFGLQLRYASTYHALTSCETIEISKEGLLELLSTNFIVRLNYLNMLCRNSQTTEHNPWKACPPNLEGRIVQFVKNRVSQRTVHQPPRGVNSPQQPCQPRTHNPKARNNRDSCVATTIII